MGIVFRQSVKTTVVSFSGVALGGVLMFLSARFLPKQEFGFLRNLTNQAAVLGGILVLGLQGTLGVYIHRFDSPGPKRRALLGFVFLFPVLAIALTTLGYFLFSEQIIAAFQPQDEPLIRRYFAWLPAFVLFFVLNLLLETYLTSQMRVAKATFVREIFLRCCGLLLFFLFVTQLLSFGGMVAGTVLAYAASAALLVFIATRTKGFSFSLEAAAFTAGERKDLRRFTVYHALLFATTYLIGFLDTLMLAALSPSGLEDAAVYSLSLFLVSIFQIPMRSMSTSFLPTLTQTFSGGDRGLLQSIFQRCSINMLVAAAAMALIIGCNLHNAAQVLGPGYASTASVALILIVSRFIDAATGPNEQILSISNHYRFSLILSLCLVALIACFNRLLIPHYGLYGAAWASTLAISLYNLGKFIFVWRRLGLQPFTAKSGAVIAATLVCAALHFLLPVLSNPYWDTLVRTMLVGGAFVGLTIWIKPSVDIQKFIHLTRNLLPTRNR